MSYELVLEDICGTERCAFCPAGFRSAVCWLENGHDERGEAA